MLPFPDPFDIFRRPLAPIAARTPSIPPLTPEEESSILGQIGHGALSGLSYVGGALNKPGRAIRGLLGGQPREMLNVIPFSDALGITDPTQEVRGTDLIGAGKDTSFFSPEGIAGFGTEILLDPLTYMTFGASAVNKLGHAAKKVGVLPKGAQGRLAGVSGDAAQKLADNLGVDVGEVAGKKLGGHVGFHLPLTEARGSADLTKPLQMGSDLLGMLPGSNVVKATGQVLGEVTAPLRRGVRAMFDPSVMGQWHSDKAQELGRSVFAARNAARASALEGGVAPVVRAMGEDALTDPQGLRTLLEGTGPASQGAQRAAQIAREALAASHARAVNEGVDVGRLENYLGRQATRPEIDVGRPGGHGTGHPLGLGASSLMARTEVIGDLPTETVERMVRDPRISSSARTANAADAEAILRTEYGLTANKAFDVAPWLYSLHPDRLKIGYFNKHALTDYETSLVGLDEVAGTAQAMKNFITQNATDVAGPGAKRIGDVIREMGLTEKAEFDIFQKLGTPAKQYIPQDVADALVRATKPFTMPETLEPVKRAWDSILNLTKSWLTQAFPSFHVRNLMSGMWQNYVIMGAGGLTDAYSSAAKMLRGQAVEGLGNLPLFRGMTDEQATKALADMAFGRGVTGGHAATDLVGMDAATDVLKRLPGAFPNRKAGMSMVPEYLAGMMGQRGGSWNPMDARGVRGATESNNWLLQAGEGVGTEIEHLGRVAGFIGLVKKGYVPDVAAAMTKAGHVDYTAMTKFEREVMKRIFPFYAWTRGNVPHQLKLLAENPGGPTGVAIRASTRANEQPGFTPEYLGQGVAVPVGAEENGTQRFLSQLGLPFEDLGQLPSPGRMVLGNLGPIPKYLYESMSGQQAFSGRDLRDLHSRMGELGLPMPVATENLLMNSPLARVVSTAGTIADERKDPLTKLLNLTTGVRMSDVNTQRARDVALREYTEDLLRGQPGVNRFERLFVSPTNLPLLSPQEQQLYRLYQARQRRNAGQ